MKLTPYIIGSGMAAQAIESALQLLQLTHSQWEFESAIKIGRDQKLAQAILNPSQALVFIANPHGLHASRVLEADELKVKAIFAEKPVCTDLQQCQQLISVKTPVNVFHGYRYLWGVQKMHQFITNGELGELISIEGRYWQSSEAGRVLEPNKSVKAWKEDPKLSGGQDVLFDLATHWMDLVYFLSQSNCGPARLWMYYRDQSHRDSHLHIETTGHVRTLGSISKIFHGGSNNLQISAIGTHGSVSWEFITPDYLQLGKGNQISILQREEKNLGTGLPAFHATGWLEGYVEIIKRGLGGESNLQQVLSSMQILLDAQREEKRS